MAISRLEESLQEGGYELFAFLAAEHEMLKIEIQEGFEGILNLKIVNQGRFKGSNPGEEYLIFRRGEELVLDESVTRDDNSIKPDVNLSTGKCDADDSLVGYNNFLKLKDALEKEKYELLGKETAKNGILRFEVPTRFVPGPKEPEHSYNMILSPLKESELYYGFKIVNRGRLNGKDSDQVYLFFHQRWFLSDSFLRLAKAVEPSPWFREEFPDEYD